jgi:hypothetical protein
MTWEPDSLIGRSTQLRKRPEQGRGNPKPESNVAFAPHERVCEYIAEDTVCNNCGRTIHPNLVTYRSGSLLRIQTVRDGVVYKIGGRGEPKQFNCNICFIAPREAPSVTAFRRVV